MRADNATWEAIARVIGVSRWKITERAKQLNCWNKTLGRPSVSGIKCTPVVIEREPYEAGHPETWGAITNGTLLHGAKYVYQPPNTLLCEQPESDDMRAAA